MEKKFAFSTIVGVTHEGRQDNLRLTNDGDRVYLVAVLDNPYDPKAVKVIREDGKELGFIPAAHALKEKIHEVLSLGDGTFEAYAYDKRGGFCGLSYGMSVAFHFVPFKDETEPEPKPKPKAGKHPTNRYELKMAHHKSDRQKKLLAYYRKQRKHA